MAIFIFFKFKATISGHREKFCTPSIPLAETVQRSPGEMMVGTWGHWESEGKDDFQHLGTKWQVKVILHLSNGQYLKGF